MYIAPNKSGILEELSIIAGSITASLDKIQTPQDEHRFLKGHRPLVCSFGCLGPKIILNEINQLQEYIKSQADDNDFCQGNSHQLLVSAWTDWLVSGQSLPEIAQSAGRFTQSVMRVLDITYVDLQMLLPPKLEQDSVVPAC